MGLDVNTLAKLMFISKSTRKPCSLLNQRNILAIFVKQRTRSPRPWRDISRRNMDFTTRTKNYIAVNIVIGGMSTALCWRNTCRLMGRCQFLEMCITWNLKIKTKLGILWNKFYIKRWRTLTHQVNLKLLVVNFLPPLFGGHKGLVVYPRAYLDNWQKI